MEYNGTLPRSIVYAQRDFSWPTHDGTLQQGIAEGNMYSHRTILEGAEETFGMDRLHRMKFDEDLYNVCAMRLLLTVENCIIFMYTKAFQEHVFIKLGYQYRITGRKKRF